MKLYEIDAAIQNLLDSMTVDPDTGEAKLDEEALAGLQMERERKLEGVALAIKNMSAEAEAIKAEENNLAKRRKALENKVEGMKGFLRDALDGEKLKTPRVSVSMGAGRPSCKIDDVWAITNWMDSILTEKNDTAEYLKIHDMLKVEFPAPKVDAAACKKLLLDGYEIPGAHIEYGAPSLRIV